MPNTLLTDINIPVYDNIVTTVVSTNSNSPSNEIVLDDYENIEIIPINPIGSGSIFPNDPNMLPQITNLKDLLKYLSEIMIRFNSNPNYYLQDDFTLLIKTLSNSLIYLYLNDQEINSSTTSPFMGVATLTTNPGQDAIDHNNRFQGIYFAQSIGTYDNFGLSVSKSELEGSIVLFIPNISNNAFVDYQKQIYIIDLSAIETDKYFRYTQNTPSSSWNITHNLNKYPSVVVTTSAGSVVEGEIIYLDNNNVQINFSASFSGYADFN